VLCLATLVLGIDATVLNLAIPTLVRDLGATPSDIQWIIEVYTLVFAGLLLTAGSLSDRFGRRKMLVIGLVLFGGASALAPLATEPWHLIVMRALMGVGGCVLMPSTLSILITVFEADERRKAMAAWGAVSMLGVVAGPTVGGLLLETNHWSLVFLINVPVAALAIVAALVIMPESKAPARPFDPVGVVLSVVGLTSAVYVIIEREWNLPLIALAVVALGSFVVWERRTPNPMMPLELFRDRRFSGASFSILLLSFGTGALMLMLTQYLQFVLGYGAMQAGFALLPYVVAAAAFNAIGAGLGQRVSNKTLICAGMLVMAGGFVVLATTTGYGPMLTGLLLMGVGGGLAAPSAYATLMGAIPVQHAGVGSAMNDTVQQVGIAFSIAVLGSVLAGVYTSSMPGEAPSAARSSIGEALAVPGWAEPARAAFTEALHVGAWIGAVFCLLAALLAATVLKSAPGKTPPVEAAVNG
jgi:EmrB/QacA subfamily drug resistance transporter